MIAGLRPCKIALQPVACFDDRLVFLDASNCPVHRVHSDGVFQALNSPRKNAHIDIGYGKIPYLLCKARHMSVDYNQIITMEPGKRSGQPCIRGMRITVYDVLEYLAGGMSDKNSLMNVEHSRNFRAKTLAHHRSYFR